MEAIIKVGTSAAIAPTSTFELDMRPRRMVSLGRSTPLTLSWTLELVGNGTTQAQAWMRSFTTGVFTKRGIKVRRGVN